MAVICVPSDSIIPNGHVPKSPAPVIQLSHPIAQLVLSPCGSCSTKRWPVQFQNIVSAPAQPWPEPELVRF